MNLLGRTWTRRRRIPTTLNLIWTVRAAHPPLNLARLVRHGSRGQYENQKNKNGRKMRKCFVENKLGVCHGQIIVNFHDF